MSLTRDLKFIKLANYSSTFISNRKLLSHEIVLYLLKALENADYQLSVDIENDLVKIGKTAIKTLIKSLENSNEKVRSHVAMVLIRIGADIIEPLVNEYENRPDYDWLVDFIISEIKGSQKAIVNDDYHKSMAS